MYGDYIMDATDNYGAWIQAGDGGSLEDTQPWLDWWAEGEDKSGDGLCGDFNGNGSGCYGLSEAVPVVAQYEGTELNVAALLAVMELIGGET